MPNLPKRPSDATTVELLARIRGGDPEAWNDLYRQHHDDLLFFVRVHLGARLRAALQSEDVLQSVALEAFQDLPRFEARAPGGLRRYLHALVMNKIRDRADTFSARKRAGAVELTDTMAERIAAPGAGAAPPAYHDSERYERLERALDALPAELREILVLRKLDGLSSREAAERLGVSDDAARKRYSRALARLSSILGGLGGRGEGARGE